MNDLRKRLDQLLHGDREEYDWCGTLQGNPLGFPLPRGPRPSPAGDRQAPPAGDLRAVPPEDAQR